MEDDQTCPVASQCLKRGWKNDDFTFRKSFGQKVLFLFCSDQPQEWVSCLYDFVVQMTTLKNGDAETMMVPASFCSSSRPFITTRKCPHLLCWSGKQKVMANYFHHFNQISNSPPSGRFAREEHFKISLYYYKLLCFYFLHVVPL